MPRVSIWKPSIVADGTNVAYTPRGTSVIKQLPVSVDFSFVSVADGGYWEASISLASNQVNAEDWLDFGLGLHVEIYDDALVIIWEGFVNQTDINLGPLSITRGPLLNIINRCTVSYALQEIVGTEVVSTANLFTTTTDNDASKLKYGIVEKVIEAGEVRSEAMAEQIRDTHLAEYANPDTTKAYSNQGQGQTAVTLNCLGYIHFFNNYIYNASTPGVDEVDTVITDATETGKMQYVIEADPNGLFSVANSDLYINGTLVSSWEDQNLAAMTIIKSMVAMGDATAAYGRCVFGVGAGRRITYAQVPTTTYYTQRLTSRDQAIRTTAEATVFPWNALPNKWLLFTDFLVGKIQPANLHLDQRTMYIERVAFSTPWGLQLDGGKVNSVNQLLAQKGLGM